MDELILFSKYFEILDDFLDGIQLQSDGRLKDKIGCEKFFDGRVEGVWFDFDWNAEEKI